MIASRRGFISGIVGLIAAPAIVRASSLMTVKPLPFEPYLEVIKSKKFDYGDEWKITTRTFGDPTNNATWLDMRTAMYGWTGPHDDVVQSIRYVTKSKIYEHGDYSWVPVDPRIAAMRLRAKV